MKKICLLLALFVLFFVPEIGRAQTSPSPTPTQSTTDLQNRINELQAKITDLQGQEKTLSSQIAVMDSQINLTELRIDSTKRQISDLSLDIDTTNQKIGKVERSLDDLSKVLINRVVATYIAGSTSSFQTLMSSSDVSDLVKRANYLKIVQAHDRKLIFDTAQAKNDYINQKQIFEDKKSEAEKLQADLVSYNAQLAREKNAKQELLRITQNDEKNYQQLLSRLRAEFAAIQGIIAGAGTEEQIREVKKGDTIATIISGSSCNSSGAHLHFAVLEGGGVVNPFNKLKDVPYLDFSGGDPWNPSGSWDWPLSPAIQFYQGYGATSCVTSGWCGRIYSSHSGLDIAASSFTVYSVADGTMYKGSYSVGCALPYVRVKHKDSNIESLYLHVYSN